MPRATSSLPVPLSPCTRTVASVGAICTTRSSTWSISSVSPTMPVISRSCSRCTSRRPTSTTSSTSTGLAKHSARPISRHTSRFTGSVSSTSPSTGRRPRSRACADQRARAALPEAAGEHQQHGLAHDVGEPLAGGQQLHAEPGLLEARAEPHRGLQVFRGDDDGFCHAIPALPSR